MHTYGTTLSRNPLNHAPTVSLSPHLPSASTLTRRGSIDGLVSRMMRSLGLRTVALAAMFLIAVISPFEALAQSTPAAPAFSLASGTYYAVQTVALTDATSGVTIYYTNDGTTPTSQSTPYTGPFQVTGQLNWAAIAIAADGTTGPVTKAWYTIKLPTATPVPSVAAGTYTSAQTISLSDSTPGATIYYTTNGVYPNSSAPVYTGPFTVSGNTTVQAIATASGYTGSTAMSAVYNFVASPPVFSPAPGTYPSPLTVSLSSTTPGASLYYTTDGSTPTSSSLVYSGPITVTANQTMQAIAIATNYASSAVSSATYKMGTPNTPPTFSPAAGTYVGTQTVSISASTNNAVIYYTTNGSTPTTGSAVYSAPLTVSASQTLSAITVSTGGTTSSVGQAAYTITQPAAPVYSPVSAVYTSIQNVAISDASPGVSIYYTTNGTTPTSQSTLYTSPVAVSASTNFQAVAITAGGTVSPVTKAWYTINLAATVPVISLPAGAYGSAQTVSISDSTPGAVIHYTTTGVYPNSSAPVYTGPFTVSSNTTVQAMATATGYTSSSVVSASYTIAATAPVISLASGTYNGAQTVTLSSPTPGGYFHYTTNGTTPTSSSTYYSGPFTVSANETVVAMTWATNYTPSAATSATYVIMLPAATPTFSPAGGTYLSTQTVSVSSSTPGVSYHYTTDGSTPTLSSALYSGPLTVSANETVQVVAYASNYTPSAVASATYAITPPAATPVFPIPSAVYNTAQTITMTDSTSGAVIHYTTNATTPTAQSPVYTGPITLSTNTNFQASAIAPGGSLSPVAKAWYNFVFPTAAPVMSPASGTYSQMPSVTITDSTPGATIYYTLDRTYPNTSSPVYTGPISAPNGTQITAIAVAPSYSNGPGTTSNYTVIAPPPVISPSSGTYTTSTPVTITDAVAGAQIHYTMDGSLPTSSSPIYYSPIIAGPSQTQTMVFQAMVTATGYLPSSTTMSTIVVTQPSGTLAQATVGTTPLMPIPANFMGLSTNYDQPPLMMGQASTGVNQAYRTLLQGLTANATAPLLIRLPADDTQLTNVQAEIEPLVELAQAVNVDYTLGVDLWNNSLPLAESEASAWINGIPNNLIYAIEIGNEPDVYPFNGARPSTYSYNQYLAQFQQWQTGVNNTTGNSLNIIGPSFGSNWWVPNAEPALAANTLTPAVVSQHGYLGNVTQASGAAWPSDYLLYPSSATQNPTLFAGYAAAAHQAGRIFRMDEINSFYNGGVQGISTTFSSALWSIDTMFNFVNDGFDGVNWITAQGTNYQLFQFHSTVNGGMNVFSVTQVAPLYYGLLVFSQMAGNNAQLLPVTTTTNANVSIWATVDSTSSAHVIVINKDKSATGNVQITLPGYTTGTIRYLLAANYSAANGVTFGGQTFDGTPDGTIQGSLATTTITGKDGVFTVPNMPITSAALIDFN
jgi:hypothetical protein